MFLEINDFLKAEEVARLRELGHQAFNFVDGRISNPHNQAKNNLQASETDPLYVEVLQDRGGRLCPLRAIPRFRFSRAMSPRPFWPATRWA